MGGCPDQAAIVSKEKVICPGGDIFVPFAYAKGNLGRQ
jgi:hypothetical protein